MNESYLGPKTTLGAAMQSNGFAQEQKTKKPEDSAEKIELLNKLDRAIQECNCTIYMVIDKLTSERSKLVDLERTRADLLCDRIGGGAMAIISQTISRI
jgi:hypothetical protein